MRDYLRILHIALRMTGLDYVLYLALCLFEVLRNAAILFSAYWGVSLLAVDSSVGVGVSAGVKEPGNDLWYLIGGVLASVVCELAVIGINYFMNKTEEQIEASLYRDLLLRSAQLPLPRMQDHDFRVLFRDVLEEGMSAVSVLAMDVSAYFRFGCNILIYVVVALRAGWGFVLVSLLCIVVAHFFMARAEREVETDRALQSQSRNRRRYYVDLLDREIHHVDIVGNRAGAYFSEKLDFAHRRFIEVTNRIKKRRQRQRLFASLAIGAGAIISLFFLFVQSWDDQLPFGHILVIVLAEVLLFQEMSMLMRTLGWDREALHFARKYLEFLEIAEMDGEMAVEKKASQSILKGRSSISSGLESVAQMKQLISQSGDCEAGVQLDEIRFMDVCLDYGEKRAVDGVSLTLRKGQKILLIGENGSGKTSLLNLLAGLYEPTEGRIVSGRVSSKSPESSELSAAIHPEILQRQTAYVSQSFPMLAISVRDSFFCPNASDAEVWDALERVDLKEKVESNAKGLGAIVGKEIFFSKGQWQRLIVARLLVHKDKRIWILDEPTSAMDSLREERVLRTVFDAAHEKVLVIVSHRLGVASEMDQIIHMDGGNVFAVGTHQQMLRTDARYREAYESQKQIYRFEVDVK